MKDKISTKENISFLLNGKPVGPKPKPKVTCMNLDKNGKCTLPILLCRCKKI